MQNLSVRLRTNEESKAAPVFDVPYGTDLNQVIAEFRRWGVSTPCGEYGSETDMVGQYVFADGEAYFEVVIELDD